MTAPTRICFASIYVGDYEKALAFYQKYFGYAIKHLMGDQASWGKAGDAGIYLEGGNKQTDIGEKSARCSVVFGVDSAFHLFKQLKDDGVHLIHNAPQDMGSGDYWFQFRDPSGNILEILGGI